MSSASGEGRATRAVSGLREGQAGDATLGKSQRHPGAWAGRAPGVVCWGHCRSSGRMVGAALGKGWKAHTGTAQAWRDPCGLAGAVEDRRCLPGCSGAEGRLCKGRDRPGRARIDIFLFLLFTISLYKHILQTNTL